MIVTTTTSVEGRPVQQYLGVVTGEVIVGGRAGSYEKTLRSARNTAFEELEAEAARVGGNAVIGVDIDYEVIGKEGSMLMVTVSGTAVRLG